MVQNSVVQLDHKLFMIKTERVNIAYKVFHCIC